MKITRGGFTLVGLLVVITIIALLISLLLPAVQAAREAGRRAACMNNVKQLCLAMQNYHGGFQMLPINFGVGTDGTVNRGHSWILGILPYVEQQGLFDKVKMEQSLYDSSNTWVSQQPLPLLICPADSENRLGVVRALADIGGPRGSSNYKACAGSNWNWGSFQGVSCPQGRWAGQSQGLERGNGILCANGSANAGNYTAMEDIKDGASNTFAVGEAVPVWSRWSSWYYWNHATATCAIPLNHQKGIVNLADAAHAVDWANNYCFFSKHAGGGHFGMVDGSVRFLSDNIDTATYRALATISGGELVQLP